MRYGRKCASNWGCSCFLFENNTVKHFARCHPKRHAGSPAINIQSPLCTTPDLCVNCCLVAMVIHIQYRYVYIHMLHNIETPVGQKKKEIRTAMKAACHRFASPGLDRLYDSLILLWNAYPGLFPGVKRSKCETNITSLKILRIRGAVTSTPRVFVAWFLLEQREDFLQKLTCFTLRKYTGGVGTGSGCYPVTHFGNSRLTGGKFSILSA